jgi:hypothetical protein
MWAYCSNLAVDFRKKIKFCFLTTNWWVVVVMVGGGEWGGGECWE